MLCRGITHAFHMPNAIANMYSLLMSPVENLRELSGWSGSIALSRELLLSDLSSMLHNPSLVHLEAELTCHSFYISCSDDSRSSTRFSPGSSKEQLGQSMPISQYCAITVIIFRSHVRPQRFPSTQQYAINEAFKRGLVCRVFA
jgi:hypothetical protein